MCAHQACLSVVSMMMLKIDDVRGRCGQLACTVIIWKHSTVWQYPSHGTVQARCSMPHAELKVTSSISQSY